MEIIKHLKKIAGLIAIISFVGIVTSCSNNSNKAEEDKDSVAVKKDTGMSESEKIFYKIPSPAEMYLFLKEKKAKFNGQILNPVDRVSRYNSTEKKALNFGLYASTLAYCSLFEQNQKTLDYYSVAKKLADELGLMEGFDENIAKRIDANINNADSLYKITSEAYWTAYNYVEAQNKTNLLPYIMYGSWLESLYIAINSVPPKFSPDDPIVVRIVEQEFLIENLISLIQLNKNREQFEPILSELKDLLLIFEELYTNDKNVLITKEQFKKISDKVTTMRNQVIN